jgi:hypothetical protein
MGFFIFQWLVLFAGLGIHFAFDNAPSRHTARRLFELGALWTLVSNGAFAIFGGIYHIGPSSASTAQQIGYHVSMFQWEVGWGDIGVGVLGVLCARAAFRGQWMTAAITALTFSFVGDGIGHVMQLVSHGNHAIENVGAIPTCFGVPLLAIAFTALYRRSVSRAGSSPVAAQLQPISV